MAHIQRKHSLIGVGCWIQGLGLLLFVAAVWLRGLVGIIVAFVILVALFVVGSRLSYQHICSNCGNRVPGKYVKICPVCKEKLE
ncbi:hypothetical protein JXI42_06970 [bacterium]|nr:hypothetical protein [bacterium]